MLCRLFIHCRDQCSSPAQTAANVLALTYMDYANAQQRAALVEEFYGPEFALFKVAMSATFLHSIAPCTLHIVPTRPSMFLTVQSPEKRTLDDIFVGQPEEKKKNILSHMRDILRPLIEKGRAAHHMLHRVLLEYLHHAPPADKAEMIDTIREAQDDR